MKMDDYINLINDKLDEYLQVEPPHNLFKSMKYTVSLPGKRLRPIMCLETCRVFGGEIEDAIPTACAIEMLHAQTLIHDDLPCMDNDAGDALLTYAPQIITQKSENLSPSTLIRIINEYFNYAGARGVIAGQVVDIESEKLMDVSNKDEALEYIHIHKTSDLFQLSMRTGAIIAGVDDEMLKEITEFAKNFGLAFQIADDILDEISTFEKMGKTLGKDKEEGKLTYVSMYGIEEAKCKLACIIDKCRDIMAKQEIKSEIFEQIIQGILERVGI